MTRANRLMDLAEMLRGGRETTVSRLAAQLGVSERSVRRDLATLRERGMAIEGEAGPGGGVRMQLATRGAGAVHFTIGEAVSLWLTARMAAAASDLPWAREAESALAKILNTLPPPRAHELRSLCKRVVIGEPASARVRDESGTSSKEVLQVFEEAFSARACLGFEYTDRLGRRSLRRVEPHGLLVQPPIWYVLARDIDKDEPRMFRMDRIANARALRGSVFMPDNAVIWSQLSPECSWLPLYGPRVVAVSAQATN